MNITITRDDVAVVAKSYFERVVDFYRACIFPIFILIGILGNCFSLYIFPRMRRRDQSTAVYLSCLAASDLLNLLSNGLPETWMFQALKDFSEMAVYVNILGNDVIACKVFRYIWYISMFTSSWILSLFNVEKCIAIRLPLKRSLIITSSRRKTALLIVVVVALAIQASFVPAYELVQNYPTGPFNCGLNFTYFTARVTVIMILLGWLTTFLIPWFTICACCILITCSILESRRLKLKTTDKPKNLRFILNLTLVSGVFLVCIAPGIALWGMFWITNFLNSELGYSIGFDFDVLKIALYCTNLQDLNFCLNFIIYVLFLDYYRAELKKIFHSAC
ncbi:cysteinyl leukotriene receptor 2-like [Tubulanus polymorphus]|uniref:cysteinyl leukotriene receptor 2-like n=1 Tax=Tubulanus polymorphus TaxID=672921 RepID=UPI003DA3181F